MKASSELLSSMKRLKTFGIILLVLFILNVIFTLFFQWEGIYIIVNIYLYVFSFYLIFIFSEVDLVGLRDAYEKKHGNRGVYIVFFLFRVLPFLVIYFITALSTLISYLDKAHWPLNPVMDLVDGRYSNTVFYSLILLIILKLKKEPRITIPIFFAIGVVYFGIYRTAITFSTSGWSVSALKVFQVFLALFFLIYEFFFDRRKAARSAVTALGLSMVFYLFLAGGLHLIFRFSPAASYQQVRAADILMKMGYSYPLPEYKNIVLKTRDTDMLFQLVFFSRKYHYDLSLQPAEWARLLRSGSMANANVIIYYLDKKGIALPYRELADYAEQISGTLGKDLVDSVHYIRYCANYVKENRQDLFIRYRRGSRDFRVWSIRVMARSRDTGCVGFLLDVLTGADGKLAGESYFALKSITGVDPAGGEGAPVNSPDVLLAFKEASLRTGRVP